MNRRARILEYARVAGYHNDTKAWTRLLIENRVSRSEMEKVWAQGKAARANSIGCHCPDCLYRELTNP